MTSRQVPSPTNAGTIPFDPSLQVPAFGNIPTPLGSLATVSSMKQVFIMEDGTQHIYTWNRRLGKTSYRNVAPINGSKKKSKEIRKIANTGKEIAKSVAEVVGAGMGAYDKARGG